jgi:hypothetical protein
MTIVEALQEVCEGMQAPPEFIYADLNEANLTVDQIIGSKFPVFILLPIVVVDNIGSSSSTGSTFDLQAFMLTRSANPTVDYKAETIETEVIAPMRLKARQFIHRLNEHSIIDSESKGIRQVTYQPIYSETDANLFGVMVRATVPVRETSERHCT